ncbi:MAG: PAS domain-containing protein [Deltaproteobacteria bacterium]|jgi:two-component system sensor histidine kinase PilS (NtrC family)|nr:PAS domain-containing protein [Deltaproteobacteria bacterium]
MQWFPRKIEKSRQKWLFVFRLGTGIFVAGIIVLLHLDGRAPLFAGPTAHATALAIIAIFALAVTHYLVWPRLMGPPGQITIQVLSDISIASVLIVVTGGSESSLVILYIITVVNSAFLGGLKVSFIAATLATGAWAGIVDMHYYGYLPGLPPLGEHINSTELAVNILVNTGASYMVAILGGQLSSQLDISSQALVSSQSNLDRLAELNDNIIHSIDSGIITVDKQNRALSINQAAREILRVSAGEVIGRHWRFFFPELDGYGEISMKLPHARDGSGGFRFAHVRPVDRAELILELNMLALVDEDNEPWGGLLVFKDLTAISQMEAEVRRSEHLAAIGELAAGLAHEIRTPLASMKGAWHMMLEGPGLGPEDGERIMRIIGREMDRLNLLVNDFLSFARPSAGNPQPVDLHELVESQIEILRGWKRDQAAIELSRADVPPVWFDRSQLTQVVWNLLQNAIEAADPARGVRVEVEIARAESPEGCARLTIRDFGRGISAEHVKHIFEPFYTTKANGTGLGLATSWAILKKGSGNISVRSVPGSQTVFTLTLPLAGGHEAGASGNAGPSGPSGASGDGASGENVAEEGR